MFGLSSVEMDQIYHTFIQNNIKEGMFKNYTSVPILSEFWHRCESYVLIKEQIYYVTINIASV